MMATPSGSSSWSAIYKNGTTAPGGCLCQSDAEKTVLAGKVAVPMSKFNDMLIAALAIHLFDPAVYETTGRLTIYAITRQHLRHPQAPGGHEKRQGWATKRLHEGEAGSCGTSLSPSPLYPSF